jgi:hypothetical protein
MRRGLSAIVLLACSSRVPVQPTPTNDAGAAPGLLLAVSAGTVTVVRGESVTFDVLVSPNGPDAPPATIGFGPLPLGMTGTTASWQNQQGSVSLTLDTTTEVAAAKTVVDLRAWSDGVIAGDQPIPIQVTNEEGWIDPTFGQGGVVQVQAAGSLRDIAPDSSGGWTVSGVTSSTIVVAHLDANGAVQDVAQNPVPGFDTFLIYGWAVNADGRKAIGVGSNAQNAVVITDSSGVPTSVIPVSELPVSLAWVGNDVVVGRPLEIDVYDSTQLTTQIPFAGALKLCGAPDGSFYVLDAYGDVSHVASTTTTSKTSLPTGMFGRIALDSSGRVLVGAALDTTTDFGVLRLLPSGDLDATFGAGGYAHVSTGLINSVTTTIVELPGGGLLVGGFVAESGVFARFDDSGANVTSFGSLGHTLFGKQPTAMALDANATRACVVDLDTVYCLRLTN